MKRHKKIIAIDFDGVIHNYSQGWADGSCYDLPVTGALYAIQSLANKGYKVVIFTARDDLKAVKDWFRQYYTEEGIPEITNKKPKAIAYIDDRGIRFTNWTDILKYF